MNLAQHRTTTAPGRPAHRLLSQLISLAFAPAFAAWVLPVAAQTAATPATTALPSGGQVVFGHAQFQTPGAAQLTVSQSSDKAILQWQRFDIGRDATVRFEVPSASSVTLNRVLGSDASAIHGRLSSNGQLILINPNGVVFGASARVDAGGIVASTLNLSDDSFLQGQHRYSRNGSSAGVLNQGEINAQNVALLGTSVHNEGVIRAPLGRVVLAAGETVTLGLAAEGTLGVAVEAAQVNTLVANRGLIEAGGGQVLLSAQSAYELLGRVVNSGQIEASGVDAAGGLVALRASGQIEHSGRIAADGTAAGTAGGSVTLIADLDNAHSRTDFSGHLSTRGGAGGEGGFIETSATTLKVADGATVDARAPGGRSGHWLLDPRDFTIAASGGDISGSTVSAALANADLSISSNVGAGNGNGDIFVNDSLAWDSGFTLRLIAQRNIYFNAPVTIGGTSGLTLYYGQATGSAGNTAGYFVTRPIDLGAGARFSTRLGANGTTRDYTVITALGSEGATFTGDHTLQGMQQNANYVLGADIDASATANWAAGFAPAGGIFAGQFDGLGHSVSGLNIRANTNGFVGLFGEIGSNGSVRNVNLRAADVQNLGGGATGALAGRNGGVVWGASSTGNVSGSEVGGLVGRNGTTGSIENSHSAANVSGTGTVGGLVGASYGRLRNVYASGSVTGSGTPFGVGGLLGALENYGSASVENAYARGAVSAPGTSVGGLVGHNSSAGSVINSYYDVQTTGIAAVADSGRYGSGLASAVMQNSATYTGTGWDFTGTWRQGSEGYPVFSNIVNPMTLYVRLLSGTYASTYGSAPVYTWGLFDSASGGNAVNAGTSGTLSWTGLPGATSNAGSYSVQYGGGLAASSYDILAAPVAAWTVNPKALTLTGLSAASKTYDGTTSATLSGTAGLNGVLVGDTVTLAGTALGAFNSKDVATATGVIVSGLSLGGGSAGNYTLGSPTLVAAITPKALTLGGMSVSDKIYDGNTSAAVSALPVLVGTVAGDTVSLGASPNASLSFNSKDVATAHTVTLSGVTLAGADSANYSIGDSTYAAKITPATLTVSGLSSANKDYDGTTTAALSGSASLTGVLAGEAVALAGTASASFNSANVATANLVTVNGLSLVGADIANYTLAATTQAASITPLALSLTGLSTATSKTYDGSTAATLSGTAALSGVLTNDTVTLAGTAAGTFNSKNVADATTVTVGGLTLSGTSAGNYSLGTTTLSSTITPKTLTLNGTPGRAYDGTVALNTAAVPLTGLVGTETLVVTATATSANVTTSTSVANTLATFSLANGSNGGLVANYAIDSTVLGSTVAITPKQLTLTGTAIAKVYDGGKTVVPTAITFTGLVSTQTLTYSNAAANSADVGTGNYVASLTLGNGNNGGLAANYKLPTLDATHVPVNITPKSLNVTLSKPYDGNGVFTASSATLDFSGLVGTDTTTASGGVTVSPFYVGSYGAASFTAGSNTVALGNANYTLGTLTAVVARRDAAVSSALIFNDYLRNQVSSARYKAAADAYYDGFYKVFCPSRACDKEVEGLTDPVRNFLSKPNSPELKKQLVYTGIHDHHGTLEMVKKLFNSAESNSTEAWYYLDVMLGLGWKP